MTRSLPCQKHQTSGRSVLVVGVAWVLLVGVVASASSVYAQISTSGAEQITVGAGVSAPDGWSGYPVVPALGDDFVVFSSRATNLAGNFGPQSSASDNVFMYSPGTGMRLISKTPAGNPPAKLPGSVDLALGAYAPAVSRVSNGSYAIVFASDALDLVNSYAPPGSSGPNPSQVYIFIRSSNGAERLQLVSSSLGNELSGGDGVSDIPTVAMIDDSPAKYRICFRSRATDLGTMPVDDTNFSRPSTIFCREITVTEPLMISSIMEIIRRPSTEKSFEDLVLSGDGRVLAFSSDAQVVNGITANQYSQVYDYSFASLEFRLLSKNGAGGVASGDSREPSLSYTGATSAFRFEPPSPPSASGLAGFTTAVSPICVRLSGTTYRQINSKSDGTASLGACRTSQIDASGAYAVFSDTGGNLVHPYSGSTGFSQAYLKNIDSTEIIRLSVTRDPAHEPGNGDSGLGARGVAIGSESNTSIPYVAFGSYAPNLASVGLPSSIKQFVFRSAVTTSGGSGGGNSDGGGSDGGGGGSGGGGGGSDGGSGGSDGGSGGSDETNIRPPRTLTKNINIEVPPQVRILNRTSKGLTDLEIILEEFTLDNSLFGRSIRTLTADSRLIVLASKAAKLKYHLEIKKAGSKKRITRILSRNTTTIRKLSPGRYTIRYRVVATKGKKKIQSRPSSAIKVELT